MKPTQPNCHKGNFAHVAVLEGDAQKRGASRLAALAALRAGAGLVTLLVDKLGEHAPGDLPEFMKEAVSKAKPQNYSILVLGPGITTPKKRAQAFKLLKAALAKNIPVVLDAGALELLKKISRGKSVIFATPHPGEAGHLLGVSAAEIQKDRQQGMRKLIALSKNLPVRVIWVLKGANTIVAEQAEHQMVCEGDVPALAVGGSGDVLSGAIAGFWGRTKDALDCAVTAVKAHLEAGRRLSESSERGHLASEIANALAKI